MCDLGNKIERKIYMRVCYTISIIWVSYMGFISVPKYIYRRKSDIKQNEKVQADGYVFH